MYGNLLRLTSSPQERAEQYFEPIFKRFAFEWVLARSASQKEIGTRKKCLFRCTGICCAGYICSIRSLYSAECFLLRATQYTAFGGMRTQRHSSPGEIPRTGICSALQALRRRGRSNISNPYSNALRLSGFLREAHHKKR